MAPHEQAEEFISSYRKLMQEDMDVNNFQKILEMKVSRQVLPVPPPLPPTLVR